ncbi:MAG: hypothetical protein EHM36_16425, partial [Deltaproteobacteria bacterium]
MKSVFYCLAILSILSIASDGFSQNDFWKKLDDGLWVKDSKPTLVKIDPHFYSFKLLCATEHGNNRLTAKDWCLRYRLVSAINAGMYQEDGLKSVGYMKN